MKQQGFTLIELMIVVAIVGIISAVAYPSYVNQVANGRRTEVKTILVAGQQWMERFYTENYSYSVNGAGTAVTDTSLFGGRFTKSPESGFDTMYDITLSDLTQTTYTIVATRKASSAMANDECGNLTIDHLGRKSIVLNTWTSSKYPSQSAAIAACWK